MLDCHLKEMRSSSVCMNAGIVSLFGNIFSMLFRVMLLDKLFRRSRSKIAATHESSLRLEHGAHRSFKTVALILHNIKMLR